MTSSEISHFNRNQFYLGSKKLEWNLGVENTREVAVAVDNV